MPTTYLIDEFIDKLILVADHTMGQTCEDVFEDLRLTKLDLAHLCAEAVDYLGSADSRWCGVDTSDLGEWYMVTDAIWDHYGPADGCLCIGCLEDRMGRQLIPGDFKDVPLNTIEWHGTRSDRLRNRLGLDQPTLFDAGADVLERVP